MGLIAVVREAEPWSAANYIGAVVLLIALVAGGAWLLRRYFNG